MLEGLEIVYEDNYFKALLVVNRKSDLIVDKGTLLKFINSKGVLYGIDNDWIDNFLYLVRTQKIEEKAYTIAIGLKPKDGNDGEICIPSILDSENNKTDSNTYLNVKVDFRFYLKDDPVVVEENDVIGFYIPPGRGEPGINVKGEIVQPKDGKELSIIVGENVKYLNNKFISKSKGALKYNVNDGKAYINVVDVCIIDGDVDYTTGNIEFPGTVIIKGEVKSSFLVSAAVDIYATRVLCAIIKAQGNIIIKEGIVGDKLTNRRSHCNAGGIVKAKYIQYSEVKSSDRIFVSKYILHSSVYSEERVEVVGSPGRIIGGKTVSYLGIISNSYGSKSGIYTKLIAGISYKLYLYYETLMDNYESISKEIKLLNHYLGNLGKLKIKLSESSEILNRKRILYKNKQMELRKNIDQLKDAMAKFIPIKIEVKEYVYPRVEININGFILLNRNIKKKGYFILDTFKREILFVDSF